MTQSSENKFEPVPFSAFTSDFNGFASKLGESFKRYGFAVISEHGLDDGRLGRAISDTKAFFALPEPTKSRYVSGTGGQRGYTAFGVETAKDNAHFDLKEFWHVGRDLPEGHPYSRVMPPNVWPTEVPGFQPDVSWLYRSLDDLGNQVLEAIAHYLGLERDFFAGPVEDGNSILRLLHYPPVPEDGPHIRAGAHADINVITLLLGAEEAGLQVQDRDGQWLSISPPPGSVVCNIGDMLERLTNNVLPSTIHRVVNPAPERRGFPRYSTPFFLHFNPDFDIVTLPSCISEDRPNLYPEPLNAQDFLEIRLKEIKLI
ncbi:MAG: flavonol synthase [Alphaproteobacteria bacterium PA2]|nr:MAG: flavonol synthase [Alphaproteobacteria bacterium PA2]